ncbi:MAG: lytic transglycosylase domain-containing protein [Gammaproteobacteria bacterium]
MIFFHDIPLTCINQAALQYHVPATMIISVIKTENGRNGLSVKNANGTYDLGVMQINSSWIHKLRNKGITEEQIKSDPCVNVSVGTWILAQGIANGEGWKGVGNYHSYTPKHNTVYREKVKKTYIKYVSILEMTA